MKKMIKNNIIGFIIGAIVFSFVGVYAANQLTSDDVEYGTTGTSVTQALNSIYERQSNLPKAYTIGQTITVAGEQYYVIANSPKNQDYVVALKAEPLTYNEIVTNNYGSGHINRYTSSSVGEVENYNGYGGMAYYSSATCGYKNGDIGQFVNSGCPEPMEYDESDVKHVVDDWASAKFTHNELKLVDGYISRLVKYEEIQPIGWSSCNIYTDYPYKCTVKSYTPNWIWNSNYRYWTMTYSSALGEIVVSTTGELLYDSILHSFVTVRPVINVYKHKISS